MNEVIILKEGYSFEDNEGQFRADCTISLVKHGIGCLIVDTGLPCDRDFLVKELSSKGGVCPADVDTVVATHGHSDHVGNLNLFPRDCLLVVGHDISRGNAYLSHRLREGEEFVLTDTISVVSTPGHTCSDVSVVVRNTELGVVGIAGDLFECERDVSEEDLWKRSSFDPELQRKNRMSLISRCDRIVPGHGPMFRVNDQMRALARGSFRGLLM